MGSGPVRVEQAAIDLEPELAVEPRRIEPPVAPDERDAGLPCRGDPTLDEEASHASASKLGKRRHAAQPPGVSVLSSGTGIREERGDADEAVAVEGSEVERRREVLFGEH